MAGCGTNENASPATARAVQQLSAADWEGLARVEPARDGAEAVWARPEATFPHYRRFSLLEPEISFRRDWKRDQNTSPVRGRITDAYMEEAIRTGCQLLREEFTQALIDAGYEPTEEAGADVLLVRPSIMNLDITAPQPEGAAMPWTVTYAEGAGSATLVLELYDGSSRQLLVRAIDSKEDRGPDWGWQIPRTRSTNIADVRRAFADWAQMLVNGLGRARAAVAER